jgi:hypothetical protein
MQSSGATTADVSNAFTYVAAPTVFTQTDHVPATEPFKTCTDLTPWPKWHTVDELQSKHASALYGLAQSFLCFLMPLANNALASGNRASFDLMNQAWFDISPKQNIIDGHKCVVFITQAQQWLAPYRPPQ